MPLELLTRVLRHAVLFQLLNCARAYPASRSSIFRSYIREDDPDMFRVVSRLEDTADTVHARRWYAALKHHLAFIIRTAELKRIDSHEAPHVAAVALWSQGVLLFIVSAPRSRGGKLQIRLAPDSPWRH